MARKMKINRLAQDELTYELTIRGIGTGTCEQMRISLSRAIQMEKEGASVKRPPHPYSFEEDVTAITGKLKDAKTGIEAFSEGRTGNQYAKWETKLNHLLGRIEWINVSEGDEEKQKIKSEFLAKIFGLMSELDNKAKQYEIQSLTPAEISLLRLEELSSGDSGDEDRHNETLPGTSRASDAGAMRRFVKSTPVAKWDLNFSGEKKGMSLNAFLQRVEELRVARHVSRDELFDTAVDLFKGKALIWYRAVRKEVNHWDDLVKLLREEFQPCDYNEKLFEEIKRRTQGSDESIGIYLSIMSAMFSRLTCPVGEDVQLKIIMRNISPFYQTQLGLVDITSITQLRTLGRKLEARREAVEAFSLPSRRSTNALEPDLAYVGMASSSSTVTCDTFSDRTERGKRTTTFLESRGKDVGFKTSTTHFRPVLDFILDQCDGDERPYLRVNVLGRTLMGLLDSGASVTILGQPGWDKVKDLNFRLVEEKTKIRVANGDLCESLGYCEIPFSLRSRIKLVKVLIVTGLPHTLILGANFWRLMGIVPDLRHNEWQFSKESQVMEITADSHLREHTVLSSEEGERLKEIVNRNMSRMGSKLGCTSLVQH
ncbi:hypothetical protein NQ317_014542, partial [Molorchus minor]